MKSKQILRKVNNDAHLVFVGLFCFVHVVQLSSRDGKDGNRKSVSSNVCCGITNESTGLSVLKTEQLRGRMKSSMDKVTPGAGVLLPAAVLEPWDTAC